MTLFAATTLEWKVDFAQWIDRGIVVAVVLASAVALSLNVADPDLWINRA